jgi:hydrogenase maturation protease
MNSKILVIGVGNPLRRDDGIGSAIIKMLQAEDNQSFVLVDGGTDGLALLDQLMGYEEAIIVDAVQMMANPGIVRSFTPEEAKINIKSDVLSTHGFGLAEMLNLMEKLNIKTKITIIGIQPKDINFGEGLSNEVKNQIPEILNLIKQKKV